MKSVTIIYGSNTGGTEKVAFTIKEKLESSLDVKVLDVANSSQSDLEEASNLILGASTWNFGDIQDDWDAFMPVLKRAKLDGKTVAIFGLGDGHSYGDTFVDGIGTIYYAIKDKGCKVAGSVSTDGYEFSDSTALDGDHFYGLPLDEDNEPDQTESRVDAWLEAVVPEFN